MLITLITNFLEPLETYNAGAKMELLQKRRHVFQQLTATILQLRYFFYLLGKLKPEAVNYVAWKLEKYF